MKILNFPSSPVLTGNMQKVVVSTSNEIAFVLKTGTQTIVEHSYKPNAASRIEIDLKSIIMPLLEFKLSNVTTAYQQPDIMKEFTVSISEIVNGTQGTATTRSFKALRGGVDDMAETTANFLKANFLTWQPNVKGVTYYTPEFLTYYAAEAVTMKATVHLDGGTTKDIIIATLTTGKVWTVPVGYAVIKAKVEGTPLFYDVWIENAAGNRLTYLQRYYAENMKSVNEDWVLFENSLGGIDTFRAYGNTEHTAEHTHNIAEIDEDSQEYRVDTNRTHNKNTGYLDKKERVWLLDFFPSTGKYIYTGQHLRRIVVTESDVTYTAKELPSSYTFKYKYADARPYLNIPRTDTPQDVMNISAPDLGSFTIAPRLVEFPRQTLSEGALFPVQDPNSEGWGVTSFGELLTYIKEQIEGGYQDDGSVGHTHANITLLNALSLLKDYLMVQGKKISAGYADKAGDLTADSSVYNKFVRKDVDDTVAGTIRFLREQHLQGGAKFGKSFVSGLYGIGGRIDGDGYGELRGLRLWEWLEVPEIRYNRVQYVLGLGIRAVGGGIIESVVIDTTTDSDGNTVNTMTGGVYLKLEDGEYGAVDVDDMHMGLWHDMDGGNATANTDNKKGIFEMRGFKTSYFRVTEIPATDPEGKDNSDQHYFRYVLRPLNDGGNGVHPFDMMHFGLRGNFTKKDRQNFVYETTEYEMKLTGVNTWTFQDSNIYYISGILDGFTMESIAEDGSTYIKHFSGYGSVLGNAYIYGTIDQFERAAVRMEIDTQGMRDLAFGESVLMTCTLKKAGFDVTDKVTRWEITRDSGDPAEDAAWALKPKVKAFNGSMMLSFTDTDNDLSLKVPVTAFTIKAYQDETQVAEAILSI